MLQLNGTELALIVAAITFASPLLSSIVVRRGTRYAARLNGSQRATEEELRVLFELQEALVAAAAFGSIYVLNIKDIKNDPTGQPEWKYRRLLAEPFLVACQRVAPLVYTVESDVVREQVESALIVMKDTMKPDTIAGQKAWMDAKKDPQDVINDAVLAVAKERRRLLDEYPSK
jgi:hypothetical protein